MLVLQDNLATLTSGSENIKVNAYPSPSEASIPLEMMQIFS